MERYIPVAQTRPEPPRVGYCNCEQDTKERLWEKQFYQMGRDISVRLVEPVKVNHLQR